MYLQLAEKPKRKKGEVRVSGYNRSGHVNAHGRRFPMLNEQTPENPYIFFPTPDGNGIFVHESKFDGLTSSEFRKLILELAPYQQEIQDGSISEPMYLASKEDRKRKKEDKMQGKEDKNKRKNEKAESKNEARQSREERKKNRKPIDFGGIIDSASGFVSKFKKGGADDQTVMPEIAPEKPFYLNPLFIGGAIAIVGGAIYFGTRKK